MISNCGSDERGKYSGGQAGDQTGKEWRIIAWYNRLWNVILRHPDAKVREEIALLAEKAANNNLVGYDQGQRGTYWQHLKASNYDPSKITVLCEADCSAGVLANVKAVGYRLNIDALKNVNQDGYTGNEKAILKQAGFTVLTDKKYLTSDQYLLRGDILLYEGHHTATNLTNGSKASAGSSAPAASNPTPASSGNSIVREGQRHASNFCGAELELDGIRGSATKKAGIKVLQQAMNSDYRAGLAVDGVWGTKSEAALGKHTVRQGETQYMVTALEILLMLKGYNPHGLENPGIFGSGLKACVIQYQKDHGLVADGIAGHDTFKSLIA